MDKACLDNKFIVLFKPWRLTVIATNVLLLCGCANRSTTVTRSGDLPALVGRQITMTGKAMHNCPGAMVCNNDCQVYIEGMNYWPTNLDRQQVRITGRLEESQIRGLYVIRDAKWTLAK